jgi:predicted P-loop ATPase
VKQWWESEVPDEELPAKASKREIVDSYFEHVCHEWLETLSQVTVE